MTSAAHRRSLRPARVSSLRSPGRRVAGTACLALAAGGASAHPAQEGPSFVIAEAPAAVVGEIAGYRGIYTTGTLTCLDAVTRIPREIVFEIDAEGRFAVELDLLHPVLGGAHLDLEGSYIPLFLVPGETTSLLVGGGGVEFRGDTAEANRELALYGQVSGADLTEERALVEQVQSGDLDAAAALTAIERFAGERRAHLAAWRDSEPFGELPARAVELDITYEAAHAAICFRYTSSGGRRVARPGLPDDFVDTVLERYPLDAPGAFVSRRYIDYLANVVEVLEKPVDPSVEARIAAYRTLGDFTEPELEVIAGIYRRDPATFESEAFAAFDTPENQRREFALRQRYELTSVLDQLEDLPPSEGRDLVVSQAVAKNYLAGDLITPSVSEWARLEALIASPTVRTHLRREFARRAGAAPLATATPGPDATSTSTSTDEFDAILRDARGKVVYIDFWATWCAPCRAEFPSAKRLARAFEGEDVLFLGLCAQSDPTEWERLVAQQDLDGRQVFLADADYRPLATRYSVRGFPTYVLIDRNGQVVTTNAPRPSSSDEIADLIRAHLE